MSEHTKEPWKHTPGTYVTDDNGIAVCRVDFGCRTGAEATANMRRIVECVNAMAGIDNPQEWVDNARFYSHETVSAIVRERDELAEVLQEAVGIIDCLRDYVCEGGSIALIGAISSVREADDFMEGKARAALAKYRQPEEVPELFPGTLEKLRDLGKKEGA